MYLLHPSDHNIAYLRDILVSQWIDHYQFVGCLYCADNRCVYFPSIPIRAVTT